MIVTPAAALRTPVSATMFPDETSGTWILSLPTIMLTCWTLSAFAAPKAHTVCPCIIVPEYILPTATSPAWGSIQILVIISDRGPLGSQPSMAAPASDSRSPFHILGILYCWATSGEGSLSTDMSRRTSCTGAFLASSFCCSL